MADKSLVKVKTPAKPTRKRKKRFNWDENTPALVTTAVIKYGSFEVACEHVGMSKQLLYRHLRKDPELEATLTRARARHRKQTDPNRTDLFVTAMESLESLLVERERTWTNIDITQMVDQDDNPISGAYDANGELIDVYDADGKQIEFYVKEETQRKSTIDPSMKAIERVLGKRAIERVVAGKSYEDRLLKANIPLNIQMLGRWAINAKKDDKAMVDSMDLLSDAMDLFNIRLLQAETRSNYEADELDIEKYSTMMLAQTAVYQRMKHSIEQRYAKLAGQKSYYELMQTFQSYVAEIFRVTNEIAEDKSIGRETIVIETIGRLERTANQQELSLLPTGRIRPDK